MVKFEIRDGGFLVWDGKTSYPMNILNEVGEEHTQDMDSDYAWLLVRDIPSDVIIDTLLKKYHHGRVFKWGYMADLSLVISMVGPRGSGKSVGAVNLAIIDYFMRGKRVWSNLPIEFKVSYRETEKLYQSIPLDKALLLDINDFSTVFADGLILIDELNIAMTDSRRSMSNASLFFSYLLQEVRKRKMSILYTMQAENWADSRLRWQTDFYIQCRDKSFLSGKPTSDTIGRKSDWKLHDMSGMVTGEVKMVDKTNHVVAPFKELTVWNTPFWNCYSTDEMQAYEPMKVAIGGGKEPLQLTEGQIKEKEDNTAVIWATFRNLRAAGYEKVVKTELWGILDIKTHQEKTKTGELLSELGFETTRGDKGREYKVPTQDELDCIRSEGDYEPAR